MRDDEEYVKCPRFACREEFPLLNLIITDEDEYLSDSSYDDDDNENESDWDGDGSIDDYDEDDDQESESDDEYDSD